MPIDADILLSVLLVAVYLVDSMHFLSIGEALITTRAGRPRRLSFGSGFELGGRRVFLSNPFTPFWPEFRVEWDTTGSPVDLPADVAQSIAQHLRALRIVTPLMAVSGILVVLVAPIAIAFKFEFVFLVAVGLALLVSIAACAVVVARRSVLGLTAGQTVSVVFVALICLPCAPNLVRAVTRRRHWRLNARELPQLGFDPAAAAIARASAHAALLSAQSFVPEEGEQRQVIEEQLRALNEASIR
jgi:hypothetical protein